MIVTLTPNPALDLTLTLDALERGESARVPTAGARAGGKGLNVARILHERGCDVLAVAGLGGATGSRCRAELESARLPGMLVSIATPTRTTYAIVTPEDTTNLNEVGGDAAPGDWAVVEEATRVALARADVLVVSGSLPPGLPAAAPAALVAEVVARGLPVVADLQGDALLAAVDAGAAFVKPNRSELLAATAGDDVLVAARTLAARGRATVIASLGADGLLAVAPSGSGVHARLDAALPGNPTGAGDAAVAAVAAHLDAGDAPDLGALARVAIAWSAAAVLHPLAGSIGDPAPLLRRVRVAALD